MTLMTAGLLCLVVFHGVRTLIRNPRVRTLD